MGSSTYFRIIIILLLLLKPTFKCLKSIKFTFRKEEVFNEFVQNVWLRRKVVVKCCYLNHKSNHLTNRWCNNVSTLSNGDIWPGN